MIRVAVATALASLAASPAASDFVLSLPVDCTLGETCFVQHLVDRDPGAGVSDYRCGTLSYNGHKGTDFALPTLRAMQQGVAVKSAALGMVAAVRDGMPDSYYDRGTSQLHGQDCGNGVLVRHADGWETQYCHLKRDSIAVAKGDHVLSGQYLGDIGLSGKTQFPHLHLSVRHNGQVVDPFAIGSGVCGDTPETLWKDIPDHTPGGLLSIGFSDRIPDYDDVRAGQANSTVLPGNASAIVIFGFAYAGQIGDVMTLDISGPNGHFHQQTVELDKAQARFFRAAGRRHSGPDWPPGRYTGTVKLTRNGEILSTLTADLEVLDSP